MRDAGSRGGKEEAWPAGLDGASGAGAMAEARAPRLERWPPKPSSKRTASAAMPRCASTCRSSVPCRSSSASVSGFSPRTMAATRPVRSASCTLSLPSSAGSSSSVSRRTCGVAWSSIWRRISAARSSTAESGPTGGGGALMTLAGRPPGRVIDAGSIGWTSLAGAGGLVELGHGARSRDARELGGLALQARRRERQRGLHGRDRPRFDARRARVGRSAAGCDGRAFLGGDRHCERRLGADRRMLAAEDGLHGVRLALALPFLAEARASRVPALPLELVDALPLLLRAVRSLGRA